MTNIAEQTLATIVTNNNLAVPVLEKHDLDYCCKGKRTLAAACLEKGLAVSEIIDELQLILAGDKMHMPFDKMNAEQLISYILIHHHFYVKQSMPLIISHLEKVAAKHGAHFPYMPMVLKLFSAVQAEMTTHMQKEEVILFPRIKGLEMLFNKKERSDIADNYISGPIEAMESEHDHAGAILYEIRELTNNYTAPPEACTTFRVSLAALKEFEEDLHKHVHLENNLLFPLANKMLQLLREL
ncbi:MAG: iron-sulfur cluster repair di-iron protein [Ferruginibacter sp.]